MILDEIAAKRKEQLEREKAAVSLDEMKKRAANAAFPVHSFKNAIADEGLSVITEVKKASPSKGLIQPDFDPVKIAREYEKAGAKAISCLTEEHYFQGSSKYLADIRKNVSIPLLRKDFIFDEYQIYEAKAIGADAVLLIAALLSDEEFKPLYDLAHSLGLDVLCEAHDDEEVLRLVRMGCNIIGVNNRNLKTFEVDIENTKRLAALIPENTLLVCESGIKTNEHMKSARSWGADGVLIGETLMRSGLTGISECMKALREGV
ncbi:MAG: indole-3-glycerol phosphate synthase TrpC [Oscillospiraceae bacterium]|nr:indole-3-glycerol phosphate synthase TrpC [Oscillospiraceae bacterium]MDY6209252.1 indole-3-glycerol phosphate synthase TrpC [Oscillospiraceae bacterium]